MDLKGYRKLFVGVMSVLVLLALIPALTVVISLPGGEGFSELWLLGPEHMAEGYPSNVKGGKDYTVYVGVENRMGAPKYYSVRVKFRNQSETPPQMKGGEETATGTPSPLPVLYEYQVFLDDGETWEEELNFSFSGFSSQGRQCRLENLSINGFPFSVDKPGTWNAENEGFYYQIFVELWIYNVESGDFEFHNRFVGIWLNMTTA